MEVKKARTRSLSQTRSKRRRSSRSRSRSRSRGRSPARSSATKKPAKKAPGSPARTERAKSATPTRMSSRLAAQKAKDVVEEPLERNNSALVDSDPDDKTKAGRNMPTSHSEFGGPIGAFFLMLVLPTTLYGINLACNKESCNIRKFPTITTDWRAYLDLEASLIFLGWFLFQAVLYILPIGAVVKGQPVVRQGNKRLPYRCNGFFALVVSLVSFGAAVYLELPVTVVYDKFLQIMTAAVIFSCILAVLLYVKSCFVPASKLSPGGNTGNLIYDFFIGHELNPRTGSFDWKFFCEMRPGLIGWVMINLCFVAKDFKQDGVVDPQLAMVAFFQAWYVADALWFEDAILTTMDIVYEGFGLMLAFGDLAWVPFLYTLQGRFLLEHPHPLPWYCLVPVALLNFVGYFIFRGSNSQKNEYRKNPNNPALAHLETIPTQTSRRLLVSGWWGICRKPNYLGDLIMALSWSLLCGFDSIVPYFYPVYFLILLIHRERRDDALCARKYKTAWSRYCERVPYRIFPKIY